MKKDKNEVWHYGILRRSGRYPWGSGGNAEERSRSLLGQIDDLRGKGMSDGEIASAFGMKTTEFRQLRSIAKAEKRAADSAMALRLHEKGMSNVAIGKRMKINESSVRSLLNPALIERANITKTTADMIKDTMSKKGVVDIGAGVETHLGISRTKLNTAVRLLKEEGYNIYYVKTQQLGTGKYTSIKVLAPPGMEYKDVYLNRDKIATITDYSIDSGRSFLGLKPVQSINGDRIKISYAGEGGEDKDGVIELRRGVEDLSLGSTNYAQVRVAVDGKYYLKGMAMYSDNLPDGVDIVYNTTKKPGTPREKVFKEMKVDPKTGKIDADNPFGATIKREGQRGALNIVNEEGDWAGWSKNISSQVLSKQSPVLAKKQLELGLGIRQDEFEEIMSLTNPVVKKRLLESFADGCDSSSVHLKAAALPRQASHVILPITSMKPNEVYAPMYKNGENVVLIRHPHGGTFEIPELRVNNKNREAKNVMGMAIDAVGIHPSVAQRLSGADFDGDTVIVIPNPKGSIKSTPALSQLKDFDTRAAYPPYNGMKTIDGGTYNEVSGKVTYPGGKARPANKQLEMGKVSNLITDMTIKGATPSEIARAVKHSMVVIDSEKHALNYKQSEIDNGIPQLKQIYQGGTKSGAATLISKASSQERVPHRVEGEVRINPKTGKPRRVYVDPTTGEKLYETRPETFVNKSGKTVERTTITTKMAAAKSAFELSSGTKMESVYAAHADALKELAKKARIEATKVPNLEYSKTAKKVYAEEVESLKKKLKLAYENKPMERQAQLAANAVYRSKLQSNPDLEPSEKKRLKGQALTEARLRVGASKYNIDITPREWEAIQLGAVSHNTAVNIILNTDLDTVKIKAMPRTAYKMTDAKVARAKAMMATGYTPAEIASALGVSTTTIVDTLG